MVLVMYYLLMLGKMNKCLDKLFFGVYLCCICIGVYEKILR